MTSSGLATRASAGESSELGIGSNGRSVGAVVSTMTVVAIVGMTMIAIGTGSTAFAYLGFAVAFVFGAARLLTSWRRLTSVLLLIILFIPIKRYEFPVQLPFDLEPYRVFVAFLILVWIAALLIDPRIRLRRSGIEVPLIAFFLVILVSVSVNSGLIDSLGVTTDVIKTLSFFTSFVLTYFVICSVVRTRQDLEVIVRVLVGGGAAVATLAIVEYRTGFNVFNHLSTAIPILRYRGDLVLAEITRSDRLRVYASAQHPIALAAALVMLAPLGVYLALSTRRLRWWCATILLGLGALATLSRTAILMLVVGTVVFWRMRPVETKRLLPLLVPAVLVAFLMLPQALGTLRSAFFPKGGLVADQTSIGFVGDGFHSGRLATLAPGIKQWEKHPFFGQGFGSRVVDSAHPQDTNTNILDDQWLSLLIEVGAFGVGVLIWLFVRATRLLGRLARHVDSRDGLLAGALATSIIAFGVGAITYDAFSFIQVTFLFFVALALGGSLLTIQRDEGHRQLEAKRKVSAIPAS
jgi:hypothetical protein